MLASQRWRTRKILRWLEVIEPREIKDIEKGFKKYHKTISRVLLTIDHISNQLLVKHKVQDKPLNVTYHVIQLLPVYEDSFVL